MKHKKIKLVFIMLGCGVIVNAQQGFTAAGGDAQGVNGSIAYSIGQVFYTTITGVSGSITQGVEQPYEIFSVGVNDLELDISIMAFPNPTADYLLLSIGEIFSQDNIISYKLFDLSGKLIEEKNVESNLETIDMESLPNSTYILKINNSNREIKTFKIIKN